MDHACVFNQDDPLLETFMKLKDENGISVFKSLVVEQCSSEGMARFIFNVAKPMIQDMTGGRAFLISVTVKEDFRNSATYSPELD